MQLLSALSCSAALIAGASAARFASREYVALQERSSIIMETAPQTSQPFIIPHGFGQRADFGGIMFRTIASRNSTGGAFDILVSNSQYGTPAAFHHHAEIVEGFFVLKGIINSWMNDNMGRELTQHDWAYVPRPNNHTYQYLNPDTEVIAPIFTIPETSYTSPSIEELFTRTVGVWNATNNPPFNIYNTGLTQAQIVDALTIGAEVFNMTWELTGAYDNTFANGTTVDGINTWHVPGASESLPGSQTPYAIGSNQGPKYLQTSLNYVTQPLATKAETGGYGHVATITLSPGDEPAMASWSVGQAFQVLEGQLSICIGEGGQQYDLIYGDMVFVPENTRFSYWSSVQFTKILAISGGSTGLAPTLISQSQSWPYAVWAPTYETVTG